jgi:hypothetical protein
MTKKSNLETLYELPARSATALQTNESLQKVVYAISTRLAKTTAKRAK